MLNIRISPLNLFVVLFLCVFIFSCSLERKIAKNYIKSNDEKSVLLFFPSELSKLNLKAYRMPAKDSLQFADIDSFLMNRSLFLQYINDSVFIAKCKQGMIEELNNHGIHVYEYEQMDEFKKLNDSSYVLNLAQMQLEEYIYQDSAEDFIDDMNYTYHLELDAINLNSWFELKRNRSPHELYPILYSSFLVSDSINGTFVESENNDTINFFYLRDTLSLSKIYELAENAGKNYANNFYDYMLNIYVQDHLPKNQGPKFYYHYNRKGKNLHTVYYDGFTEIDP